MQFSLISPEFKGGNTIPTKYTCDGEDASPPLTWDDPPEGTRYLALIMDDPDAPIGVFTHWVLFNLPKDAAGLPEGLPNQDILEGGGIQGRNGYGQLGYGGPCPPPGPSHIYRFRLYAVDMELSLEAGASKEDVLGAIRGHILAEAELTGRYGR